MRPFLTGLWLFGVPVVWLLGTWWFVRSPRAGTLGSQTLGDALQIGTVVFAIAAVLIAIASYQQAASLGQRHLAAVEEQKKILEGQRQVLEESRRSLERQALEAAERSRQAEALVAEQAERTREAEAQLESVKEQQRAVVSTTRRPRLEFSLGDVENAALLNGVAVKLSLNGDKVLGELVVRNVGDVPLTRPAVTLRALPSTVRVDPSEFPPRAGIDLAPAAVSGGGVVYAFSASIPDNVRSFVLLVVISGDNLARQTTKIPVEVVKG